MFRPVLDQVTRDWRVAKNDASSLGPVLVHLASGVGNIVFATPMLKALSRGGYIVDVIVEGDYAQTADLLRNWSAVRNVYSRAIQPESESGYEAVIPAVPPFYWGRYARHFRGQRKCVKRPPDDLFYRGEQDYYLAYARGLGCETSGASHYFLPIPPDGTWGVGARTLVLAPGCKTGEMAAKRWPYFVGLAERFDDVVVVGTGDDLVRYDATLMRFSGRVRSLVDRLTLRETASVLAAAGVVVANDSGLGHVAGAVGAPTILLFGPTPDRTLGQFPPNVSVLRAGLPCEPCWFGPRFRACESRIDCLSRISVERVAREARICLGETREGVAEASAQRAPFAPA